MQLEEIGKFISQLRKEKNLTQAQLEELIGVDRKQFRNGKMAKSRQILQF